MSAVETPLVVIAMPAKDRRAIIGRPEAVSNVMSNGETANDQASDVKENNFSRLKVRVRGPL